MWNAQKTVGGDVMGEKRLAPGPESIHASSPEEISKHFLLLDIIKASSLLSTYSI